VRISTCLQAIRIRSRARQGALYAHPKTKSIHRFMDQVRERTRRTSPLKTKELIVKLNPLLRGWGEYYKRAHVRRLFHRLDGWLIRRLWSHRYKHWRNAGWKRLPRRVLYQEHGLVNLVALILSLPDHLSRLPSPTHFRRRLPGRVVFATHHRYYSAVPTTDRASLATSLSLIGLLTLVPPRDSASSPEVTRCSSVPCRPQSPWCGGRMRTPSP
jgi:Group II intron, maturase-specific domain